MPFALEQRVLVAAAPRDDGVWRVRSVNESSTETFGRADLEPGMEGWQAYVAGVVWALRAERPRDRGSGPGAQLRRADRSRPVVVGGAGVRDVGDPGRPQRPADRAAGSGQAGPPLRERVRRGADRADGPGRVHALRRGPRALLRLPQLRVPAGAGRTWPKRGSSSSSWTRTPRTRWSTASTPPAEPAAKRRPAAGRAGAARRHRPGRRTRGPAGRG